MTRISLHRFIGPVIQTLKSLRSTFWLGTTKKDLTCRQMMEAQPCIWLSKLLIHLEVDVQWELCLWLELTRILKTIKEKHQHITLRDWKIKKLHVSSKINYSKSQDAVVFNWRVHWPKQQRIWKWVLHFLFCLMLCLLLICYSCSLILHQNGFL